MEEAFKKFITSIFVLTSSAGCSNLFKEDYRGHLYSPTSEIQVLRPSEPDPKIAQAGWWNNGRDNSNVPKGFIRIGQSSFQILDAYRFPLGESHVIDAAKSIGADLVEWDYKVSSGGSMISNYADGYVYVSSGPGSSWFYLARFYKSEQQEEGPIGIARDQIKNGLKTDKSEWHYFEN